MAVNFVMKLVANGSEIAGECEDDRYQNWIEVLAYEWSGERAGAGMGSARRSAQASMGNFVIRKRADAASPPIFRAFTNSETCTVTLILRKAGGEQQDYMTLELKHAVIAKLVQGNLAFGGESPEEEVQFSYQSIRIVYDVQDNRTGIVRGGIEHEYVIMGA